MSKSKNIFISVAILLMLLGTGVALSAWTEPTSPPPDGNVSAPINVSATGQTKSGALTIQGDFTSPIFYDFNDATYYVNPAGQSVFSGSIGIATTSPGYTLDVWGTARFTQPVIVGTPTADTHATTKSYVDSAAGGGVGAGSSGQTLRHDGTSWIGSNLLYNNGTNIGIGTTGPDNYLHIETSRVGDLLALNLEKPLANANTDGPILAFSYNEEGSSPVESGDNMGMIGFRSSYTNNTYSGYGAAIKSAAIGTQSVSGSGGQLEFWTTDSGTITLDQRMTIAHAGNVGIGTTSPGYKLDVQGTGRFTDPVIVGTPTADTHATTKSYVDSAIIGGGGETVGYWTQSGTDIYNSNTGNVGIGTTSPGAKLDINSGDIFLDYDYALKIGTDNNFIRRAASGSEQMVIADAGKVSIIIDSDDNSTTDYFNIRQNSTTVASSTELFRIQSNGNVGIGTTSPGYKLDVQGTGRFTSPLVVGTPTGDTHATTKSYVDSAAGGGVGAGSSGQTLRHDGTSWVGNSLLYNNGTNVGIGTTSPSRRLTVVGNSAEIFLMTGPSGHGLMLQDIPSPAMASFLGYNGTTYNDVEFRATTGYGSQLVLKTNGNVGIGTTSPSAKLDVVGDFEVSGNSNTCHLVAFDIGGASCPDGYYTWDAVAAAASGYMMCCKVDNPI